MKQLFIFSIVFFSFILNIVGQGVPEEITENWNKPVTSSLLEEYSNEDAVIVFNREYKSYNSVLEDNMFKVLPVESWHRRIKINSQKGFDDFVTTYIPLLQDVLDEMIIVDIKARTIKKNGEVHIVKSDFIKETTLPANAPFLYGYKGKVKQFAFQNIEIGDEIEYYYTITYKYGYPTGRFSVHESVNLSSEYVMLENSYSIITDKNIKFISYNNNCSNTFTKLDYKNNLLYELKVTKPAINKDELFDNNNYSMASIDYVLYYGATNPIDTWEKLIKEYSIKASKNGTMTTEQSVIDIALQCNKDLDINSRVKKAFVLVNSPLEEDTSKLFKLLEFAQAASYYEAQQYVLLLKKMDIESNIVLLKNKKSGALNKNNIFYQFNDVMVEYKSEDGIQHYIPVYKPHSFIDDINYKYQNTLALRVNGKTNEIDFIQMPAFSALQNKTNTDFLITINQNLNNKTIANFQKNVLLEGAFEQIDRYSALRQYSDTTYKGFSNYEKNSIENNFSEVKFNKLKIEKPSRNQLKWNVNYDAALNTGASSTNIVLNISSILEENYKVSLSDLSDRTESAYFNFPFTRKNSFLIKIPKEYSFVDNKLLSMDIKNNLGNFKSKFILKDENTIELQVEFILEKEIISVQEWPLLLELYLKAYNFQSQKIYALKK